MLPSLAVLLVLGVTVPSISQSAPGAALLKFSPAPPEAPAWDEWEVMMAGDFALKLNADPASMEAAERLPDLLVQEGLCLARITHPPCQFALRMEVRSERRADRTITQSIIRYTIVSLDGKRIEGMSWSVRLAGAAQRTSVGIRYWALRGDVWERDMSDSTAANELCMEIVQIALELGGVPSPP
jgi:hypothetical protein